MFKWLAKKILHAEMADLENITKNYKAAIDEIKRIRIEAGNIYAYCDKLKMQYADLEAEFIKPKIRVTTEYTEYTHTIKYIATLDRAKLTACMAVSQEVNEEHKEAIIQQLCRSIFSKIQRNSIIEFKVVKEEEESEV